MLKLITKRQIQRQTCLWIGHTPKVAVALKRFSIGNKLVKEVTCSRNCGHYRMILMEKLNA